MPDNTIEEIKSRLDIVDIIKEYVELEKVGSNLRAPCPFHAEKTPSFFVSPSRQTWRCFGGCGIGGDMFEFVMKIEGIEFFEALKILAKKAGVEIKKQDIKKDERIESFYKMYELATKFYVKQLESSAKGQRAKKYLIERGILEESIIKWKIGFSPDSWDSLSKFLISKGLKRKDIVEAGLSIEKGEKIYDRFRGRIMFPIMNISSRPIAFGGRIFENDQETAKYLNSPQTPLYDKSKVLYGLNNAKIDIRRYNKCILVEGYTDVIMVSQSGFQNVVSTSGTALTEMQLNILSRYSKNILTAFDMDKAGNSATKKGIEMARKLDFDVKVITLPQGQDPADLVKESSNQWEKAVENAKDIMEFYFEVSFIGKDLSNPKQKKEIAADLLPVIKKIPNKIEKSHWAKRLAEMLDVDEEIVFEQLKEIMEEKSKKEANFSEKKEIKPIKSRKIILEEKIISLLAKNPKKGIIFIDDADLFSKTGKILINALKEKKEDAEIKKKLDYFALKPLDGVESFELEIKSCLKEMKKEIFKKELKEIQHDILKAEKDKNKEELKKLTKKAYEVSKNLQEL